MFILDSHCHIGKKTIVASADQLVESMDASKIDAALVFAGKLTQEATHELLIDIKKYRNKQLFGIGSVSPLTPKESAPNHCNHFSDFIGYLEELLSDQRIWGLKFYTGYEHYYPTDSRIYEYLDLLVRYNQPAIFHMGDLYKDANGTDIQYAHPKYIDELATIMPNLKIVIAHIGWPYVHKAAEACAKHPNVFTDTSGFVYGSFTDKDIAEFKAVLQEFIAITDSTNKLIFGTDWPICEQKSYLDSLKFLFDELGIEKDEQEQIMGLRAANLFQVKKFLPIDTLNKDDKDLIKPLSRREMNKVHY